VGFFPVHSVHSFQHFRDAGGQAQLLAAREEAAELRCEKAGGVALQLELGAMGNQDKFVQR